VCLSVVDAWTGDADSRDRAMMVVRMRLRMVVLSSSDRSVRVHSSPVLSVKRIGIV
jgi:hypothetical protein